MTKHGNRPIPLLAFDKKFKLVGIFRSYSDAAKIFKVSRQAIINCVNGRKISCSGYYWREIDKEWIIDDDDFSELTLVDYDRALDNDYLVYLPKAKNKRTTIKSKELFISK